MNIIWDILEAVSKGLDLIVISYCLYYLLKDKNDDDE